MRYFVIFSYMLVVLSIFSHTDANGCKDLLGELADFQHKFIECVTKNAVPVNVCITCNLPFRNMIEKYNQLHEECANIYFDKDRANIVGSTEMALSKLWDKAFCDDCFDNNHAFVFDGKYNAFSNCVNEPINQNICLHCEPEYLGLNDYYNSLDLHSKGNVCYDLQDKMNHTREYWSKTLNCGKNRHNFVYFYIATVIISTLPIIFYGSVYAMTKYREERHQAQNVINEESQVEVTAPTDSNSTAEGTVESATIELPSSSSQQFEQFQSNILKLNKENSEDSDDSRSVDA